MIFDGITLHNYGVYLGRQDIKLRPKSNEKPIILFGGLNGVGKTTLLDAFQLGLFGKLANCSNKGSLAYDKYLIKCIHKSVNPKDGAAITISFRHALNSTEHEYRVTRSWRMSHKNITETIEVLRDGKPDQALADSWNEYVEQFIPLRISSLFFFDGEKIKDFADFKRSSELIATGINQLLGLDLVDRLLTDLVVLEKRKALTLSKHHERKRVEILEQKVLELNTKKDKLLQKKKAAGDAVAAIEAQIDKIDEQFRLEGGDLFREREVLEFKKVDATKRINETERRLVDIAGGGLPMVLVRPLLEDVLEQANKEEAAKRSEQMNGMLRERDRCIIDELKKRKISKKALAEIEGLFEKDINERRSLKDIDQYLDLSTETIDSISTLLQESLDAECREAVQVIDSLNTLQLESENLDRMLAQVPDAEAIAQIVKRKEELGIALHEALINRDIIRKEYEEIKKSIAATSSELEKEYERDIDAEHSCETASRILAHSKKSRATLETFREKVVAYHLSRIQEYVLSSFRALLRKETLVSDIRFDPQTYRIDVIGSDGKSVDIDRLSAGEKQLLSVSLLWGLAQASGRRLPAIIDTPLGRLDTTHRTHLVKRYFPQASHQVLLLSTDEEINEKYYRMIHPWVSQAYRLEFDEKEQTTTIQPGYFW